jgi:hypothetical protein
MKLRVLMMVCFLTIITISLGVWGQEHPETCTTSQTLYLTGPTGYYETTCNPVNNGEYTRVTAWWLNSTSTCSHEDTYEFANTNHPPEYCVNSNCDSYKCMGIELGCIAPSKYMECAAPTIQADNTGGGACTCTTGPWFNRVDEIEVQPNVP